MIKDKLEPRLDLLQEQHVLVQAWKKTTSYIRTHNWFADTLELDMSAANLPEFIESLQKQLQDLSNWENDSLRIVPAPKSHPWTIRNKKWVPVKGNPDAGKNMRPLAHVSLRDQVVATAAMLCLADKVENSQGNTQFDAALAENRRQVVSYGNRLFCDSDEGILRHRWGSTKLYRSYYKDYRSFVLRPEIVAVSNLREKIDRVAVVQADLSKFYDRVRPSLLHDKLRRYCEGADGALFHKYLTQLLNWTWREGYDRTYATKYAEIAKIADFDQIALPQGMVAAGFFANVVLEDFDRTANTHIDTEIGNGLILLDVCRYVDDIRLVLRVSKDDHSEMVSEVSNAWLSEVLAQTSSGLLLNKNKTESAFIGESERTLIPQSQRMSRIQQLVSGGFDAAGGMEVLAEIESLFRGQEQFGDLSAETRIAWPYMVVPDVRDETVARFGAGRFRSTFRSLRPLLEERISSPSDDEGGDEEAPPELLLAKDQIDAHARSFSAGLIEKWLRDPSNVRLLRIALDIYPDDEMLSYILDLLWGYIGHRGGRGAARLIALYCFSEILRAGATETGLVAEKEALPAGIDIALYREVLKNHAIKILRFYSEHPKSLPWYLIQQAMLFISTEAPELATEIKLPQSDKIKAYSKLLSFLMGRDKSPANITAAYMVLALRSYRRSQQSHELLKQYASKAVLEHLSKIDAGCAEYLLRSYPELHDILNEETLMQLGFINTVSGNAINQYLEPQFLGTVARSADCPLRNESQILDFASKWLEYISNQPDSVMSGFYPDSITTTFLSESKSKVLLYQLESLKVKFNNKWAMPYNSPQFVNKAGVWRWALGNLILFAVRGSVSPLPLQEVELRSISRYKPTASEWMTRFFGGYYGRDRLGDPSLPVSTWLDELLLRLLNWPGCSLPLRSKIPLAISDPEEIRRICNNRHEELESSRGSSSHVIFLRENIQRPFLRSMLADKSIRICIAQTVRPTPAADSATRDWNRDDPEFINPDVRSRHRRHLAAMLSGITQMLVVRDTHRDHGHRLDWLILPELSVHPEDIRSILEPFVRRHRCVVLAGLTYHRVPGAPLLVNEAVWMYPALSPTGGWRVQSIYQGKQHLAPEEELFFSGRLVGYRPCQWILDYHWNMFQPNNPLRLTGSICYDATDLSIVSDLRNLTDIYAIPALNKDVNTFDTMTQALHYHMYQMVILANNGTYGGSNAYVPYRASYKRQIFHVHGQPQASINFLEIDDPNELINRGDGTRHIEEHDERIWKEPPAGR